MLSIIKILKNTFTKEDGFSLAEGMVTAGLLGIVSLAMLQGFKQDSSTKQLMRLEDEISATMKTVNSVLKDTASCSETFNLVDIPLAPGPGAEINDLREDGGANASYLSGATGATVNLSKGAIISGTTAADANLMISDMHLKNFKEYFRFEENLGNGGTGVQEAVYGVAEFIITFTRRSGTGINSGDGRNASIRRSLNITFKTIENGSNMRVLSCANQSDITTLQLKQRMCAQMVKINDSGTTVMVGSYNPQTGTCGGIIQGLNEVSTDLICKEMGGHLVASGTPGKYNCAVIPAGLPNCINGIQKFGNDGRPICLTP